VAINPKHWPHDHKSGIVDREIDWLRASPLAFHAGPATWKRITQKAAHELIYDPKCKGIWMSLPQEVRDVVTAVDEPPVVTPEEKAVNKDKESKRQRRQELLSAMGIVAKLSEGDDNGVVLRALEAQAKLEGLYDTQDGDNTALAERLAAARRRLNGL
jgi:hypothetical protein